MAFKDTTLVFEDTKILGEDDIEVMMGWESPIMEKSAKYICQSKGDILEIGFGMGICADYIQAEGVNSHTIVEIHPQILERLNTWASGKSNVTVISNFKTFASSKGKSGAKITYWNNFTSETNEHNFDNISFENVSVSPVSNSYTQISNIYYMPKVVI